MNMQFIDHRNVPGPQTFVTHTALGERFGSTSVPPLESRSFPFEFSLGCGVVPPGTLTIVVITADEHDGSGAHRSKWQWTDHDGHEALPPTRGITRSSHNIAKATDVI
jgi:hypothetical protein